MMYAELRKELGQVGRIGPFPAPFVEDDTLSSDERPVTSEPEENVKPPSEAEVRGAFNDLWVCSCDRLWSAENGDALRQRTVALLRDPMWQQRTSVAFRRIWSLLQTDGGAGKARASLDSERLPFDEVLSADTANAAKTALGWMFEVTLTIADLSEPKSGKRSSPSHSLAYYDNWNIAREVRNTFFALDVAYAPILSLTSGYAVMTNQRFRGLPRIWVEGVPLPGGVQPHLVVYAYEQFVAASRRWLDLVATTYEIDIPTNVREYVDWMAVEERQLKWQQAHEESVRRFTEGGSQMRRVLPPGDQKITD